MIVPKVALIAYKGKGNHFNWLIRKWTNSIYSHTELVFDDEVMFSADSRENEVRLREYSVSAENWDYFDVTHLIDTDKFDYADMNDLKGAKYDYTGIIFSQIFPFSIHRRKRWFCSECNHYLLKKWGVLRGDDKSQNVNPRKAVYLVREALGEV